MLVVRRVRFRPVVPSPPSCAPLVVGVLVVRRVRLPHLRPVVASCAPLVRRLVASAGGGGIGGGALLAFAPWAALPGAAPFGGRAFSVAVAAPSARRGALIAASAAVRRRGAPSPPSALRLYAAAVPSGVACRVLGSCAAACRSSLVRCRRSAVPSPAASWLLRCRLRCRRPPPPPGVVGSPWYRV